MRKAITLALGGNIVMLKLLVGRILPRERLIEVDLPPMKLADDGVETLGRIVKAVSDGRISPSESAALATVVNFYTTAIDTADVVKRLDVLEARLRGDEQS